MKKRKIKRRQNKFTSCMIRIMVIICSFLAISGIAAYAYFNHMYQRMSYEEHTASVTEMSPIKASGKEETGKLAKLDEAVEELKKIKAEIPFDNNVYNILLIGSDTREPGTDTGRSDSMVLVSLNKEENKIHMTSFMRDMYVKIPRHGNNRINAAFSYGGPTLLMDTIQENFKVQVDRYVQVDFSAFAEAVDMLGGINNVELSKEEAECINMYINELNLIQGITDGKDIIAWEEGRKYNLNGRQALCFSRIRYVDYKKESSDFGRTSRQRMLLSALFDKARNMGILELNDFMDKMLPNVSTNITQGEFIAMLLDFADYSKYEIISERIPANGTYEDMNINGMSVLKVDFDKNMQFLHKSIYGGTQE